MAFPFLYAILVDLRYALLHRLPYLVYAAAWTALVTATVARAAFSPEPSFVWALTPSSPFGGPCAPASVRLPLDRPPGEVVCVPAYLFNRSALDIVIPPLFATMVVSAAVCVTRAVALWEDDDDVEGGELTDVSV